MVRGFKDETGKFHPTERTLGRTRANPRLHDKTLQVGIQGSQIAMTIAKQAKDFAKRKTNEQIVRIQTTKERQARELQLRRDFEKRLISSFKRSRSLQIKDPVLLKNQILIDVPEIKDNSENLRFIENILNDFLKREKRKEKAIKKAKTPEEKDRIEAQFDRAELLEEADVKKQLGKSESQLKKKQQEELADLKSEKQAFKKKEEFIKEEAIQDFVEEEVEATLAEDDRIVAQATVDKKAEELSKVAEKTKDEKELRTTEAFIDFVEAQSDALDAINTESAEKKDAEEAREVAETLLGELDTGFPPEIVG
ncbi:MAG: hypothetical protein KJI69_04315 [Patescibacteria group bacterium]|nr:hypothetical protein [Patescibacteria group bacterium]